MQVWSSRWFTGLLAVGFWTINTITPAKAGVLLGPVLPYESFNDSPFKGLNFSWFHLISMTNLPSGFPMTAPGATASQGAVIGPGFEVDSVDGAGNNGHSLFGSGAPGITFTFDPNVLGAYPTAAGIVWTDGGFAIHFSAKDANGQSIGSMTDTSGCDFFTCPGSDGNPDNYRFYGVIAPEGISSIFISNDLGGIEVDHLQYGLLATAVPEPSTMILLFSGMLLVRIGRRRS